jgi:predicted lipoprotein
LGICLSTAFFGAACEEPTPPLGPGGPLLDASVAPPPGDGGGGQLDDAGGQGDARALDPTALDPACGVAPVSAAPFTRTGLLGAAADCSMWQFCQFEATASRLLQALEAYDLAPDPTTLAAARDAWRVAMYRWSVVEVFQFGPLASVAQDPYHGKNLRNFFYAWPGAARCRVEEQIAGATFVTSLAQVPFSGRGLFALEYLLFYEGSDTVCLSNATREDWNALSSNDVAARKRAFALALARDVKDRISQLRRAWDSSGNFKQTLVDFVGYGSAQEALNVVAWALLYAEREVKDYKIGPFAGFRAGPAAEPESPFAGMATEMIQANLRGFRSLFQGCGADGVGLGFDDWLVEANHAALAEDIRLAWAGAQAAADAFPAFVTTDLAQRRALYDAVKVLSDLLKGELFGSGSPVNLKLPAALEGDTD